MTHSPVCAFSSWKTNSLSPCWSRRCCRTFAAKLSGRYLPPKEAVATVRQNRLDGALLDVSLNGKSSFPVADELLGHEVPFILVTGYGGHKGDPPLLKRAPRVNLARLILPPPEQSCVEGQLQAIFAGPQGPLRLLALDCHAHPANAGTRSKMPTGQTAAGPPH